jgi:hypothetical protein
MRVGRVAGVATTVFTIPELTRVGLLESMTAAYPTVGSDLGSML